MIFLILSPQKLLLKGDSRHLYLFLFFAVELTEQKIFPLLTKKKEIDLNSVFLEKLQFVQFIFDAYRELTVGLFAWDFLIAKFVSGLCGNDSMLSNLCINLCNISEWSARI